MPPVAEDLLQNLVAAAPQPLLIVNSDGRILQTSPSAAALFSVAASLMIGSPLALFTSEMMQQENLAQLLSEPQGVLELNLRRGDGERFLARLTAARLSDVGQVALWIEDLSVAAEGERHWQELQEETERANDAKTMFLATMSHEIRTPMNGMIGMLELLMQSGLTADQREMVEVVQESGRTLLSITDEILDLSKIEAGKLTLDNISFSLRQAIEDIVELVAAKARSKQLELAWWADPLLPDHFFGDPTRLKQIGLNLLANAVKFTDRGSVIARLHSLSGPDDRPIVRIEVTDTGIGLSPEQQQRLFLPFSQADNSAMRNFGGTGLGLAICHRLTAMMGGEIGVVSAAGAGSTFWVEIPLAVDGSPRGESNDLVGVSVLVMDDLPESRATLANQLRSEGAQVKEASDSLAAEELLEDFARFDVAVVDVADGLTELLPSLLKKLPKSAILPTLPGPDELLEHWCAEQGLMPPLPRPLRKRQLLRAVGAVLGRQEPAEPAAQPIDAAQPESAGGPAILVAEDNAINRLVLTKQLRQLGFVCDMAEHGEAAWEMLQNKSYQLLLTDCIMPVLDGYELARRIRRSEAQRKAKRMPIIALTANVLEGEEQKCKRAGMDGHVGKPLTLDRLAALLRKVFQGEDEEDGAPRGRKPKAAVEPIDWKALGAILGTADRADLREVAGFFAESFAQLLDDLAEAMAAEDQEAMVRAAHSAKGAARNGAAPRLAAVMAEIEEAARDGEEKETLDQRLAAARDEFKTLRQWLAAS